MESDGKPVDVLMQEHRLIERVLDALELAAGHLERRHAVRPGFFLDAAAFIQGFADGCHHRKEEGVLFGALSGSDLVEAGGPVDMLLDEHEQGRRLTRAMRDAATRLQAGDEGARDAVVSNARRYAALLRDHIEKEDEMLFPMADHLLSAEQQAAVMRGFDRVELEEDGHGAQQRFPALAESLEEEAKALR